MPGQRKDKRELIYPAYNPDAGFALPDLAAGESVTVEFDVTVN